MERVKLTQEEIDYMCEYVHYDKLWQNKYLTELIRATYPLLVYEVTAIEDKECYDDNTYLDYIILNRITKEQIY